MSVITKKGDLGQTSLADGSKIDKNSTQLEAYGNLDELNSWLGVIRSHLENEIKKELDDKLHRIQNECFVIGSHLSNPIDKIGTNLPKLDLVNLNLLEEEANLMESNTPPLTQFIIPGGFFLASYLHVARTIARRTERSIAMISCHTSNESWKFSLKYLNRLSDWFFVYARWINTITNTPEIPWDLK